MRHSLSSWSMHHQLDTSRLLGFIMQHTPSQCRLQARTVLKKPYWQSREMRHLWRHSEAITKHRHCFRFALAPSSAVLEHTFLSLLADFIEEIVKISHAGIVWRGHRKVQGQRSWQWLLLVPIQLSCWVSSQKSSIPPGWQVQLTQWGPWEYIATDLWSSVCVLYHFLLALVIWDARGSLIAHYLEQRRMEVEVCLKVWLEIAFLMAVLRAA